MLNNFGIDIMKEIYKLFRLCLNKGREITSHEEVEFVFNDTLEAFVEQTSGVERICHIEDIYQSTLCAGVEYNCGTFYKYMDAVFAAECLVGETPITMSERSIEILLKDGTMNMAQVEQRRGQYGHIWYYTHAIKRELAAVLEALGAEKITEEFIAAFLLFIVSHERRHAVQPIDIFSDMDEVQVACAKLRDQTEPEIYFNLKHEADANAFALEELERFIGQFSHLSE